jgi:hypothetical protein
MASGASKSWLDRNWKWALPTGCLAVVLAVLVFVGVVVLVATTAMKHADAFTEAVARAKANAAVTAVLGEPIEVGWLVSGSVDVQNASGNAELSIPLSGPKGRGTLHVQATKSGGRWDFGSLWLEVRGSKQVVNLLE